MSRLTTAMIAGRSRRVMTMNSCAGLGVGRTMSQVGTTSSPVLRRAVPRGALRDEWRRNRPDIGNDNDPGCTGSKAKSPQCRGGEPPPECSDCGQGPRSPGPASPSQGPNPFDPNKNFRPPGSPVPGPGQPCTAWNRFTANLDYFHENALIRVAGVITAVEVAYLGGGVMKNAIVMGVALKNGRWVLVPLALLPTMPHALHTGLMFVGAAETGIIVASAVDARRSGQNGCIAY